MQVALEDLDAPPRSFDAAVAMVSLHHVVPLGKSLRRLSEVLRHGARLVVDEIDVERSTSAPRPGGSATRATTSARRPRRRDARAPALGRGRSARSWRPGSTSREPVPCAYMYRWKIDPALRDEEEALIAAGELPAVGSRFIAIRR